ncbi:hypothetical protein INR49_031726, partial [Caranx melampygus]
RPGPGPGPGSGLVLVNLTPLVYIETLQCDHLTGSVEKLSNCLQTFMLGFNICRNK